MKTEILFNFFLISAGLRLAAFIIRRKLQISKEVILSVSQQLSVGAQGYKTKEAVRAPRRCHGDRTAQIWIQK